MKQLFYILTFFFIGYQLYAQSAPFPIHASGRGGDFSTATLIDSGRIRIWYALNAVNINDSETYDDLQRLEIGDTFSKYFSHFVYTSDSLKEEWWKKNKGASAAPRLWGPIAKKKWSELYWSEYFKDFSKNIFTEFARMPVAISPNQYSENLPVQEWELCDDTITIAEHFCQKATCRFRGRDFVAWFAPDIPISNGPWKFGGLPGLILKVYDNEKLYVVECIRIETCEQKYPITMYDSKNYKKTERKKILELRKKIYEDYPKVAGIVHLDGTPIKSTPHPYHPLELE